MLLLLLPLLLLLLLRLLLLLLLLLSLLLLFYICSSKISGRTIEEQLRLEKQKNHRYTTPFYQRARYSLTREAHVWNQCARVHVCTCACMYVCAFVYTAFCTDQIADISQHRTITAQKMR